MIADSFEALGEDITACRLCPRLVAWREQVAREKRRAYQDWDYWGRGVPGFGDPHARVWVIGLAPGAHGSNRTGRMFTGDGSGDFLYPALHRAGFASQPTATRREDGLTLKDMFISAICRCAPPDNKPMPAEIVNCRPFLQRERDLLTRLQGIVLLGRLAFEQMLPLYGEKPTDWQFAHASLIEPGGGKPWFLCSYHPSRQNTQTGRLTVEMFDQLWSAARERVG